MSNMLIVEPIAIQAGWIAAPAAAGFPAANLADEQPLVIWKAAAAGAVSVDLDLQADTSLDTVFLGFSNASTSATWEIRAATAAQGTAWLANAGSIVLGATQLRASADALGPRYHAFWRAGAALNARHLRINLINAAAALTAGVLVVGKAFQPGYNHEWQSGRGLEDLSLKERLASGAMSVDPRAIVPIWRWTLGDLTDAELRALWGIARRRGTSRPVLAVEDPDATEGLHERLHYGTLKDLSEYAREAPQKTRWEFAIEEWM